MNNSFYRERIESICRNDFEQMFTHANVVGMAYGYKMVDGMPSSIECICVMVTKKYPINQLDPSDVIPSKYRGMPTDVVETGEFFIQALSSYIRPMQFGYSIGPQGVALAGTAGWLVSTSSNPSALYILSNNHVMANENRLPIGTPILQPGVYDGGVPANAVAQLSNYVKLNFMSGTYIPTNTVDGAIAYVTNNANISRIITYIGVPTGTTSAFINQSVKKTGRTTGLTMGLVTNTGATVLVTYSNNNSAMFTNQIVTTAMSKAGDSGSLLVDTSNKAVGLLFAGSTSTTIYNPISSVLSAFNVRLVTSSGLSN